MSGRYQIGKNLQDLPFISQPMGLKAFSVLLCLVFSFITSFFDDISVSFEYLLLLKVSKYQIFGGHFITFGAKL